MPDWLESLIAAIGGGTVVLIGVLTIFKGLLVKLFEIGIESSFEKSLEKFKNNLERSTKAYEILLNREMRFYEKLEPITAELVPLEHDLLYYLKYDEEADREKQCEAFRKHFKRYCELVIELKNENLIHQSYIPQEVLMLIHLLLSKCRMIFLCGLTWQSFCSPVNMINSTMKNVRQL